MPVASTNGGILLYSFMFYSIIWQDISVLIAKRLTAVKKLQKNPDDKKTKDKINDLDKKV